MLLSAILLGLVSSLHCIAMCGPIAMMLPVARNNPEKKALQIITYHIGRITSYSALGLLFGFFGRSLHLAGLQQQLSIFAGIIMIIIVVVPEKTFAQYNCSKPIYRLVAKGKSALGSRMAKQSFRSLFTIGIFNGLLPCAMVYAALFGALATQDVISGIAYMAAFGLGTVPLMSGVTYLYRFVTLPVRNKIQRMVPYAMVCIGIVFIFRGLSLDIAHISPSALQLFVKEQPNCR